MPAIRNTKKTLVEHLLLKQESVKDKSLLKRIRINPTPSTELYNKLVGADPCWHKVDNFYFSSCPPELYFHKNKKLLCIKEYKELLEPTLDRISPFSKLAIREQYLGHCLVSSEGLNLLVAHWQFVYYIPIVPGCSCLYHMVRCLLFYI